MESKRNLMMIAGSYYIPNHKKSNPLGEDANFISHDAHVIGVSDGVGGWAKKGVDAGEYSRELMQHAASAAQRCYPDDVDPKKVLVEAYSNMTAQGSATACIIALAGDNTLRAANLGDSGFCVIRAGRTFYKSPVQVHKFNNPYQLGGSGGSRPEEAEEIEMAVESGDVIIAGSDGLFDNMYPEEIEAVVVGGCSGEEKTPEKLAAAVAEAALGKSKERKRRSPYQRDAALAGVLHFGGKSDDITVVVAFVVPFPCNSSN